MYVVKNLLLKKGSKAAGKSIEAGRKKWEIAYTFFVRLSRTYIQHSGTAVPLCGMYVPLWRTKNLLPIPHFLDGYQKHFLNQLEKNRSLTSIKDVALAKATHKKGHPSRTAILIIYKPKTRISICFSAKRTNHSFMLIRCETANAPCDWSTPWISCPTRCKPLLNEGYPPWTHAR